MQSVRGYDLFDWLSFDNTSMVIGLIGNNGKGMLRSAKQAFVWRRDTS